MICPNCRQEIEAGSKFCGNCGAHIESHLVGLTCPECGSPLLPGAEFCTECGARVGGEPDPVYSFCPECGAAVMPGDTFCVACGVRLTEAAVPATENRQSFQTQDREYSSQQDWAQPQAQPQLQGREPVQPQQQWQASNQPQKSNRNKILMAAAAAVVLLVIGITGFWKPGFLQDFFRPTAKLENGMLALNDIALDFKQTNLKNGEATLTTVKDKEEELNNGLIGDLYVMKFDKNCQGKVTVSVPVPKDFKPTTGNGLYIKLGVGRDYPLADGKTARFYEYFDAEIKDGKAVAVIDPAASGRNRHKFKTSAKTVENKTPDVGELTEYVGYYYKEGIIWYGEGYQNSKGHFRLWYPYHIDLRKNVYMGSGEAQKLLSDLEEAYNYYKTHGYADHVDTFTPIDVYISDCKDEGGWNPLSGNIELRERSIFGDNLDMSYEGDRRTNTKATIYHETFHAVQQSIINYVASAVLQTLWFDEATSTHFEKLIIPNKITSNGEQNFQLLWQGLIPQHNTRQDGYARGVMIDYISSKLGGDAWIRECYEKWSANCWKLKHYMRSIHVREADFAANFYMEVIKNLGPKSVEDYYKGCQKPWADLGEDRYLSAIKLQLDDKTKEKIKNGEEDALPIVFSSKPLELGGYGAYVVALAVPEKHIEKRTFVNLADDFPEKCQLKLEAEGGCRIQLIRFNRDDINNIVSSNSTVIKNFKEQTKDNYLYLVLVTSAQSEKQNVVLKATLEKEDLKEGIYNGKTTLTQGKKSQTFNNLTGVRLTKEKDGRWGLNLCQANGDYMGSAPNVPLTYDAKQKVWKGHRKFKENYSSNPKKPKEEVSDIHCTMKVNTEGKEPILIVDYKVDVTKLYMDYSFSGPGSFEVHFEGKWSSELKGKVIETGKITILE